MQTYFVHETAVVDQGASIGKGSRIWHFCHVMPGAQIGEACSIGQNVFIADGVRIGDRVKIQNNVSVYGGVICEDDVFIGPSAVFTNIRNPRSAVVRKGQYVETYLGKGVTIGANATIICGNRMGKFAFVGAGSVVTRDVPAYALVCGNPARQSGWMSEFGHRLVFDGNGHAVCSESGQAYHLSEGIVRRKS